MSYTLIYTPAFAIHCQPLVLTDECRLLALRLDNTYQSHIGIDSTSCCASHDAATLKPARSRLATQGLLCSSDGRICNARRRHHGCPRTLASTTWRRVALVVHVVLVPCSTLCAMLTCQAFYRDTIQLTSTNEGTDGHRAFSSVVVVVEVVVAAVGGTR